MSDIRQRSQRQDQQQQPRAQNQNRAQRRQQQQQGGFLSPRTAVLAVAATVAVLYFSSPAQNWIRERRGVVSPDYFATTPAVNRADASVQCSQMGGKLAELTSGNFNAATQAAFSAVGGNKALWIQSYNTDSYQGGIVLWLGSKAPGGSVNVQDPNTLLNALCQSKQPFSPASDVTGSTPPYTGAPITFTGVKPHTNICISSSSTNFAVLTNTGGNPTVADAQSLCAASGLAWADVSNIPGSDNIAEVRKVVYDCVGANAGAWVRSWNTDTYNNVGLEFRSGATNTAGTPVAASSTATLPVVCQGVIPSCAANRQPKTLTFQPVDPNLPFQFTRPIQDTTAGFTSASSNAYFLNGVDYGNGYMNGIVSPPSVAFNGYGAPASYVRANEWDLRYVYATAAWYGVSVTFSGSKNGATVETKTVSVDTNGPTLVTLNFRGIDTLTVSAGPRMQIALDDMNICEEGEVLEQTIY